MKFLGNTESVCPQCLKRIPAQKIACGEDVYLTKECSEHGTFRVLIWKDKEPSYADWANPKVPTTPKVCQTEVQEGCPFDCGLCPEHRQETCCVLLEVTGGCNLQCPICFADAHRVVTKTLICKKLKAGIIRSQKMVFLIIFSFPEGNPLLGMTYLKLLRWAVIMDLLIPS